MSPQQAADACGASRWSVLRAIKARKLPAIRDNSGVWRIAPDDLAEWAAHRAQRERPVAAATQAEGELRARVASAEARADAAERARDVAEADRDHWRRMAETLAAKRRWLWPW